MGKTTKILITSIIITVAIFFLLRSNFLGNSSSTLVKPLVEPEVSPVSSDNKEVHSPDGTMKITKEIKGDKDGFKTYSFFVSEISDKNKKMIFSKTVGETGLMTIPDNTFSPDNKYVFLEENGNGLTSIMVLKTSGDTFTNDQKYLDVVSLFSNRKNEHHLTNVTGWDSPTLLHVRTDGPSFWFDLPSKSFLQLATK